MVAFGVAMIAGILLLGVWHPPGISVTEARAAAGLSPGKTPTR
jgi:hypothetical protein